jgi:hypothetical protein
MMSDGWSYRIRASDLQVDHYPFWVGERRRVAYAWPVKDNSRLVMRNSDDLIRTVSRHTLAYMLCSISEMFRHYKDFDPLDLLIVHNVLNANVINIMNDEALDKRFASIDTVEPDDIKQGMSRAALSRFLNLPLETIRRRVTRLKKKGILAEEKSGLIVSQKNLFRFGNNHDLQNINIVLVRKLLRDLRRAGIRGPDDLQNLAGKKTEKLQEEMP